VPATSPQPAATKPVSLNSLLDEELALFYEEEQDRRTEFSMPDGGEADFDLLFLNICSLSWDDLRVTDQLQHPLMGQMDIMFEAFNSVTSYSGPAVSRLMQANCGQRSHQDIYGSVASECSLFSSLHDLGYDTHVAMNHDGQFQGFIDYLASEPAFSSPFITEDARPVLRGFDNSPIWSDYETLSLWLDDKQQAPADQPRALLYNSITLHDGNREATADGGGRSSPYERRIQSLLDDLARFIDDLERRGRPTMVVLIPEHGAALEGDRMQISGLREIPAEKITRVPVGVRFIGVKSRPEEPIHVSGPTSFLALSELVARSIQIDVFDHAELDWSRLTDDLPKTRLVTENEAAVMLWHEQTPYVQLDGKNWIPYQQ